MGLQKNISKKLTKKSFSKPYKKNFKWRKKNNGSPRGKLTYFDVSKLF
jgi:hypothetical protein